MAKPYAYIFDIDGVLADCSHRLHFIQREPKDWNNFFKTERILQDKPIQANVDLLLALTWRVGKDNILFVTGRKEEHREPTANWLYEKVFYASYFPAHTLFMRKDNDFRPDWTIKKEIYENQIKDKYEVFGVFEDRTRVVRMWRDLGLPCYQVCDGDY